MTLVIGAGSGLWKESGSWGGAQGVVKRFFNEKEVTSTLVMDALFSGCKQLEEASRLGDPKKVRN